jgi:cyclomaltodextrinase / maltogenic alpha-amylase / neopullulanase
MIRDAVMNYPLGNAIIGFWKDTPYEDINHCTGCDTGPVVALKPSEFESRFRSLEEQYPKPALHAMMNLLDSHDVNRVVFMLDENTALHDPTLYTNHTYDWSDALQKLKGAALLQYSLPYVLFHL